MSRYSTKGERECQNAPDDLPPPSPLKYNPIFKIKTYDRMEKEGNRSFGPSFPANSGGMGTPPARILLGVMQIFTSHSSFYDVRATTPPLPPTLYTPPVNKILDCRFSKG